MSQNEKHIQAKCVIHFSQERPQEKGLLWATMNRTLSVRDGQTQKAMGLVKGVSDLMYFNTFLTGLEIKSKGKVHTKEHIEDQYRWGEAIEKKGGKYYIITSLDEFKGWMNGIEPFYTLKEIKKLIDAKGKSIIF